MCIFDFFFFQAEDGIRDRNVTGVQTCALPIFFNGEIAGSLNMEAGIYFFFSQMAAIMFLVNIKDRLAIVKSGIGISLVNIMSVFIFLFLSFEKYSMRDLFIQ